MAPWLILLIVLVVVGGLVLVLRSGRRATNWQHRIGLAIILTLPVQYLLLMGLSLYLSYQAGQLTCMDTGWDDVPCTLPEMAFINLFHLLVFNLMSLGIYFVATFLLILAVLSLFYMLRSWWHGRSYAASRPGLE